MLCSNPNHPYEKNLIQPKPETLPVTVQFERRGNDKKNVWLCDKPTCITSPLKTLSKLNLKKKNYGSFPSTKELDNFASSCLSNL